MKNIKLIIMILSIICSSTNLFAENEIILEKECISQFNYEDWSICSEGLQERKIYDLNNCVEDINEERKCRIGFNENQTLILNSEFLTLVNTNKNHYIANFDNIQSFNTNQTYEEVFIIFNEFDNLNYLSKKIYINESKADYYSVQRIDVSILKSEILYQENIIERSLIQKIMYILNVVKEKLNNSLIIITFYVVLCIIIIYLFYTFVKSINKKN